MTRTLHTTWAGLLLAQLVALPLPLFVEGAVSTAGGMTLVATTAGAVAFAVLIGVEGMFGRLLDDRDAREIPNARIERTLTACWLLAAAVGALGLVVGTLTGSVLLASPFLALATLAMVETRPSHPRLVPVSAFTDEAKGSRGSWRAVAFGVLIAGASVLLLGAVLTGG